LRPGRFEFHLYIPYPEADDRREILRIYDKKMRLQMTDEALESAVRQTRGQVEGTAEGTQYSGDHLNALCRAIARIRLRENVQRPTTPEDIDRALTEWIDRPRMTPAEERVVATHEAGHAVCALFCSTAPPIERISIQGDVPGTLGIVRHQEHAHKYVVTQAQLLDRLCILMGGREAELLLLDDLSIGSSGDLAVATEIARSLVEEFGMGGDQVGVCRFGQNDRPDRRADLSPSQLEALDARVREILDDARRRAAKTLRENRQLLETLRDLLLEKKVIDAKTLAGMVKKQR
jgi:cell division protease FtsH